MPRAELPTLLIRRDAFIEAIVPDNSYISGAIRRKIVARRRGATSRATSVRVWSFVAEAYGDVVAVLKSYDLKVEVYGPTGSTTVGAASKPPTLTDRSVLGVTEAAPWPVVESAYRAMAMLYHPDRAGYDETERMRQINLAYERLQDAQR